MSNTMFSDYGLTLFSIWLIIATVFVQALVAASSKARLDGAIPGKINERLSHADFAFRAQRTFLNSLENVPLFLATVFLGIFLQTSAAWLGYAALIYALARIVHMVLYYVIATEKNPSPRSYFYLIAVLVQLTVLVLCFLSLI